jgi:ribose transport system permease protein
MTSTAISATGHLASDASGFARRALRSNLLWIFVVLVAEVTLFAALLPSGTFLSTFNLKSIAADSSVLLILASAATVVIIAGGLDLSIGSLLTLSAVVSAMVMRDVSAGGTEQAGLAIILGFASAVGVGVAWGTLNGLIVTLLKVPPFIVTLGSLGAALGVARLLTGGLAVGGVPQTLQADFGQAEWLGVPAPFLVGIAAAVVIGMLLRKTRFGEHNYLIGSNEEAARRGAVKVDRHLIAVYALSGTLAGLAGFIDLARFDVASVATGHVTELIAAIAAVVIGGASLFGGTGGMAGTVIGVYIPVVLANGLLIGDVERFWQDVIIGIILVSAVAFDQWRRGHELERV